MADDEQSRHPQAFQLLYDAYRHMDCPAAVDPVDPDDCASVAEESVRVLMDAGLLLPPGGEVGEEFRVEIERPNGELDSSMWVGSRALVEDLLRRPYKFDQHRLQRRVVRTWPNGAKYIGPPEVIDIFPPVVSDNSEVPDVS